jgi:hypothetical protein
MQTHISADPVNDPLSQLPMHLEEENDDDELFIEELKEQLNRRRNQANDRTGDRRSEDQPEPS